MSAWPATYCFGSLCTEPEHPDFKPYCSAECRERDRPKARVDVPLQEVRKP